ncbi:AAA-domain-containing protein [Obba rivulosa]|uniref:Peroxisomal ATPase PEX6 n=1 Tax=Obba rivulosa TaxID=1052685 RepID=A0A8E2DT96_9APHY|nr:AAA-domain-containing protein [Obba rivulosa]
MHFLFQHSPPALELTPSFHDEPEDDVAFVSEDIWAQLDTSHSTDNRIAISLGRTSTLGRPSRLPYANSLECWCQLKPESTGLAVPKRWQDVYASMFAPADNAHSSVSCTHTVTIVQPIVLSEVILTAQSEDAFAAARAQDFIIEDWCYDSRVFLRQGATVTAPNFDISQNSGHSYRVAMTAPVLQGYAQHGVTQFYLVRAPQDPADSGPSNEVSSDTDSIVSERDRFEIDERFLAGAVLRPMNGLSSSSDHAGLVNGDSHVDPPNQLHAYNSEWTCTAKPLQVPISPLWDDCTVYVRTSDLSHIGVLDGDWAIIRAKNATSYRLVCIRTGDSVTKQTGAISMSSQLLHNILPSRGTPTGSVQMCLRSSPFGSHRPAIPIARAITIARVASPFSTDRAYQPLFLRALQQYLKGTTRLMKQGDIIAVKINTDEVRRYEDVDAMRGGAEDDEETQDIELEVNTSENANEPVYFIVTNIEHNVPSRVDDTSPDMYVGSTVGELGCWVDPAVTRIVQTGVEHSRVPDIPFYFDMGDNTSEPETSSLRSPDSAYSKLHALISAALSKDAVDYHLQLSMLLQGPKGVGKLTTAKSVARQLGLHLLEVSCYDILGDTDVKSEGTLRARFDRAGSCSPCILVLRHIDALAQTTQGLEPGKEPALANALHDCIDSLQRTWNMTGYPVFVVGTTSNAERVPSRIMSCFKHDITFEAPGEAERHEILRSLLKESNLSPDVSLKEISVQTAALVAADLVDLVTRAKAASVERAMRDSNYSEKDLFAAGLPITAADLEAALGDARASYSENIGAPKIPSVSWDDVGGLAHVKADILDTIQLPLEYPEMFADGLKKRSGILLYGPPGTGKTLLAKAVATSCALNFFSVKGPELLNMYIGESEANVRRVFQRARDARPCVIFFDELDSVAPKRGSHGDSGGVMDRIVSQLLAELDGLSSGKAGADVFVIGATNRPDLLDPALLRPGRFDRMLYLGVSTTHEAQLNILQALTRKFKLHPDLRLETIAEQCPFHYTGADFYALCADALLKAMSRKAEELEAIIARLNAGPHDPRHPYPLTPQYYLAELATAAETEVLVSQEDFEAALVELVPSVSQAEMEHYARIQQRFSKETINGSG